jgi:hypothetical protein
MYDWEVPCSFHLLLRLLEKELVMCLVGKMWWLRKKIKQLRKTLLKQLMEKECRSEGNANLWDLRGISYESANSIELLRVVWVFSASPTVMVRNFL